MPTEPSKADPPKRNRRPFRLRRDHVLLGLLTFEGFLLLADRLHWFTDKDNWRVTAPMACAGIAALFLPFLVRLAVAGARRSWLAVASFFRGRRWYQFSLRSLLIGVTLLACLLGIWTHWDYFPGTLRRERNGVFHGTGTVHGFYSSGALRVEQDYRNGLLLRERSYRPDGSLFVSSEFDIEHGGTGYYLYDNGKLSVKTHYKYSPAHRTYLTDGPVVYYEPDGSIEHTEEWRAGQLISVHP